MRIFTYWFYFDIADPAVFGEIKDWKCQMVSLHPLTTGVRSKQAAGFGPT